MATTSCCFLVFVWVVWWLPLMLARPAERQQGEGCSAKRCGNLKISDPFWIADKEAGGSCGSFDFVVGCGEDNIPVLRSSVHFGFDIKDILYEQRTLRVVDVHKEEDFNVSDGCHVPRWNTSTKLAPPFKVDASNLNLIFYNCTKTLAHRDRAGVKMMCGNVTNAFVRAGVRYDATGNYGGYALEGCVATVVPMMGSSRSTNDANQYKQLVNDGFILTWEASPLPAPAGGDHWHVLQAHPGRASPSSTPWSPAPASTTCLYFWNLLSSFLSRCELNIVLSFLCSIPPVNRFIEVCGRRLFHWTRCLFNIGYITAKVLTIGTCWCTSTSSPMEGTPKLNSMEPCSTIKDSIKAGFQRYSDTNGEFSGGYSSPENSSSDGEDVSQEKICLRPLRPQARRLPRRQAAAQDLPRLQALGPPRLYRPSTGVDHRRHHRQELKMSEDEE